MENRRRTISGDTLIGGLASANSSTMEKDTSRLVRDGIDALDLQWSVKQFPKSRSQISLGDSPKKSAKQLDLVGRRSTRSTGEKVESLTRKLTILGKRSRKTFEGGITKAKRELRNLADTLEYAHIDTKPVLHEVWSKGKLVTEEPPKKKKKVEEVVARKPKQEEAKPTEKKTGGKREKVWLNKGLYAGQETRNLDWFSEFSQKERENLPSYKPNSFMPLPMWHGQRLLHVGRNFKLPFDVCSPLPPGLPKPDEWRKTSSSKSFLLAQYICLVTDCACKIVSSVRLQLYGRSRPSLTAFPRNVSVPLKAGVTRIVKTESCSTSATTQTVERENSTAAIAHLLISKNAGKVVASIELVSKSSRLQTVVTAFGVTVALRLTRSLLNILARLSLKMSVIGE
jgi:hypothetical protein